MNADSFTTSAMRRERAIERSLEDEHDYMDSIRSVMDERWSACWSMAGSYLISLDTEQGHDFRLPPNMKHKAKLIAAVPAMLAYIIEAAKTDEDAELLLNRLMEGK